MPKINAQRVEREKAKLMEAKGRGREREKSYIHEKGAGGGGEILQVSGFKASKSCSLSLLRLSSSSWVIRRERRLIRFGRLSLNT